MGKALYTVVVIQVGRERDYALFNKGILVNPSGESLDSNMLSFPEEVSARNTAEAEAQVKKKYPKNSIDREATLRLG